MLKEQKMLNADEFLTSEKYETIALYRKHLEAKLFRFEDDLDNVMLVFEVFFDGKHCEKIITFAAKDISSKERLLKEYLENYADKTNNVISINYHESYEIQEMLLKYGFYNIRSIFKY